MDSLKNIPKQYLVVGGVIVVLLVVIGMMTIKSKSAEQTADKETVFEEPGEIIPTVDSSVKATITGKTDATIEISGIPDGTKEIEYELSYNTEDGSIEGVFGTIDIKSGADTAEEEIIFGTSSSGVNRYHKIDGPVKGTFKFTGSYGQKLLEKEFDL